MQSYYQASRNIEISQPKLSGDIEADIDTADAVGVDAAAGEADADAGADIDAEAGTDET